MIVWPGESHIPQTWSLETVTVPFVGCFLETAVVLNGELGATVCEIIRIQTHILIAQTTEVLTAVAGSTTSLTEDIVTVLGLCRNCRCVPFEVFVEG